jgi:hypothetical protein
VKNFCEDKQILFKERSAIKKAKNLQQKTLNQQQKLIKEYAMKKNENYFYERIAVNSLNKHL